MKVFVTGGTGLVGSHLVSLLLREGHGVTVLSRDAAGVRALGAEALVADLGNRPELVEALKGHDALIHNALIWDEPDRETELRDTLACAHVYESAGRAGVRHVIYTSSTAVHRPFRESMSERDRLIPSEHYGAVKLMGETLLWPAAAGHGYRANVVRPGPVVGAHAVTRSREKCDRRLQAIVDSAFAGEDVVVPEEAGRQFIAAEDLAHVYLGLLRSDLDREILLALGRDVVPWKAIAEEAVGTCGSGRVVPGVQPEQTPVFDVCGLESRLGLAFQSRDAVLEHVREMCKERRESREHREG